jgi:hypothetical protein
MSRLTKKVKAKGKAASGAVETQAVPLTMRPSHPSGVVIDGAVYPVAGEPPVATSKGWGDMSWWYWSRR